MSQPTAFLVEYETIVEWDKSPAPMPIWGERQALVFTQAEADGMATSALYCRNKRVTPLVPQVPSGVNASSDAQPKGGA